MTALALPKVVQVKTKTIFFPNLDGLRAIAAFLVVLSHIEPLKEKVGLTSFKSIDFFQLGRIGVDIFFVLSGFLITYLLLKERKVFQSIDYKKFYIRRVLRIWPLYFLVLLIGYFIYPTFSSDKGFLLSVFFLANVAFVMELLPEMISPIWSIGVEEQFYIFQPHLLRINRIGFILFVTVSFIIGYGLLDLLIRWPADEFSTQMYVKRFLTFSRFDSMLIGSVFAMVFFSKRQIRQKYPRAWTILTSRSTQALVIVLLAGYLLLVSLTKFPFIHQIIAILSGILIINLAKTNNSLISLRSPLLMKAGKISYGIYLLHKFVILSILYIGTTYFNLGNGVIDNLLLYITSFVGSYALAYSVYYAYEIYFIKLKAKFGVIHKE